MNWLSSLLHAAGKMLGHAAVAAVAATGAAPGPVATGSISAGIQAGPACITHTMHPGDTASTAISVINPNRTGWEKLDMSQQTVPSIYVIQYAAPKSWITLSAPGPGNWVGPGRSATVTATVTVPANARPGRYTALPTVTAYAPGQPGGQRVAFGSAAATGLVFSVGVSAPPKAFCRGERPTYWQRFPRLPVCKPGQASDGPSRGVQVCRYLPLPPPVASAKTCHVTASAWRAYEKQLRIVRREGLPGGPRYAHCGVGPIQLNSAWTYRRSGAFRSPGGGAPRFSSGQYQNAWPASGP